MGEVGGEYIDVGGLGLRCLYDWVVQRGAEGWEKRGLKFGGCKRTCFCLWEMDLGVIRL